MEMEVVVPIPAADFNFDSTCSSPYITAPSSPQRFGNFFFSAPTSPSSSSLSSTFHRDAPPPTKTLPISSSSSAVPFDWEEKPGTPKRCHSFKNNDDDDNKDFEFDFSGQLQLERTSLSAEELFDGGKIRPLKPPPGYEQHLSSFSSPKSPRSPRLRASHKEFDPFAAAIEETRKRGDRQQQQEQKIQRGRINRRTISASSSSSSTTYFHKGSRSLSPLRVSDIMFEEDDQQENPQAAAAASKTITPTTSNAKSYAASILSAISFSKGYRKWKLKDLLLFRSASEGRATGNKDPLRKYSLLSKKEAEEVKNASFRSTESVGSSVSSSRRRGPPVSAHELHYTANRAVSEEMKRKTFLPYKQGLLGCLGFNPGVHEISRGIGSLARG